MDLSSVKKLKVRVGVLALTAVVSLATLTGCTGK